ncbi:hypothetical protein JXA85_04820 [Candidatus Woesearchaeota archaeon]|nr:hypothetical protein [Candidatus Woesearchaeota archaeon]
MEISKKWWFWVIIGIVLANIIIYLAGAYSCAKKPLQHNQLRYALFDNNVVHDFRTMCNDFELACERIGPFQRRMVNQYLECERCYLKAESLKDPVQKTKELLKCEKIFKNNPEDWDVVCAEYYDIRERAISEKDISLCDEVPSSQIRFSEDSQSSCRDVCIFVVSSFLNDFSNDYCTLGMTKRLRNDCYIVAAKKTKNVSFCDKTTLSFFKTSVREFTLCFDLTLNDTAKGSSQQRSFCGELNQAATCRFEISSSFEDCNRFMLSLKQKDLCYLKFINSIKLAKAPNTFSCDDFNTEEGRIFCREAKKKQGAFVLT